MIVTFCSVIGRYNRRLLYKALDFDYGSTKQFGWLQASATKVSFRSILRNPATIRILPRR
jgi:hypothetical protein